MKYVLDTNVVSALRVRGRNPAVERWISGIEVADQYLAATTIAEIERGVKSKEREDPDQGAVLREWFASRVLPAFTGRVLALDLPAARELAKFRVPEHAPLDDALLAAVAKAHGMTVATRNVKHFEPLGVAIVDPWTS
ncbi:type II toxin-antitoxin system VapC family toxin [Tsukamurella pseudospumae]|uniref:Ribonuclease VapC n=1 Tax=Tsukamurella pseudospumae TaxID=239498 RepID=A0A137ZTN2_9ACTN|nr:type II toxin-antitoxin system VapC family toxin [Tsukamurella pseudospumae]KXP01529.1 addiction module protein [Tsukamurella pseudospumae]